MTVSTMNDLDLSQLQDQISRLAKSLKSEKDLGNLTQQLVKMTVEAALSAELEEHSVTPSTILPGVAQGHVDTQGAQGLP